MTSKWDIVKNNFSKVKNFITIGYSNVAVSVIFGLFWLYVASLLGTESYGEISYFIAIASITGSISSLGVGNVILVYATKEAKTLPSIYFVTILFSIIASLVTYFIFHNIGVSVYVLGLTLSGLYTNELLGNKLYKKYSVYIISQSIFLVIVSLGLFYMIGPHGIILGCGLSYFPFSLMLYKTFKEYKINLYLLKPRFRFIANNYFLSLSKAFSNSVDKLVIFPLFGYALLGNYQLGIQFLALLTILPSVSLRYILPREASGTSSKKLEKAIILISIIFAILGILVAPKILLYVLPQFKEAIEIIPIMSLAIIPRTVNVGYYSKFLANENSIIPFVAVIIFILVQIPAIFILGDFYGINGVAVALVVAATSESAFLIIMKKHYDKKRTT